jgi:hypothetical protein
VLRKSTGRRAVARGANVEATYAVSPALVPALKVKENCACFITNHQNILCARWTRLSNLISHTHTWPIRFPFARGKPPERPDAQAVNMTAKHVPW